MDKKIGLDKELSKIESLFSIFNQHFYNNGLNPAIIAVNPRGNKKASGWCSKDKIWKSGITGSDENEKRFYELNICAENLAGSFEEISEILLHEMVHLYDLQHDIQDTSRSSQYHNKKFKEAALAHGLNVEKDPARGFSNTSLNEEAKKFIETLDKKTFDICRDMPTPKESARQSTIKLVCPKCGYKARVTKEGKLICGTCNELMEIR